MSDDSILDQDEIERLLGGGSGGAAPSGEPTSAAGGDDSDGPMSQAELEALFGGGGGAAQSSSPPPPQPTPPSFPDMTDSDKVLGQDEIESLLKSVSTPSASDTGGAAIPPPPPKFPMMGTAPGVPPMSAGLPDEEGVPQGDLDYILKRADEAIHSISSTQMDLPSEVIEFQFPEFGGTIPSSDHATLDQISEVELDIKIELGRANMYLEDVLKLRKGSVVPLDKMAGDAVDIYVNGRLLARGEVLVMNENFCVRVAELLAGAIPIE